MLVVFDLYIIFKYLYLYICDILACTDSHVDVLRKADKVYERNLNESRR